MTRRLNLHTSTSVPSQQRPSIAARLCLAFAVLLAACAPLASLELPGEPNPAPTVPAVEGVLADGGRLLEAELAGDETAFWLLEDNREALRVRLALADLAQESLDIQYFIWQNDMTGRLLMAHVLAAADRGVRVRLLLDDLAVTGRDAKLQSLAAHPMIEVRLFNPWRARSMIGRPFEFVARIHRLNHRMHNKLFIADGHFGILGGRNIGDRYFGVYEKFVQNDIDVMLSGALLDDALFSFESYWNSPLAGIVDPDRADVTYARELFAASNAANAEMLVAFKPPMDGWEAYLAKLLPSAAHGRGKLLIDRADVYEERPTQLYSGFKAFVGSAEKDVILSSPYLVPDKTFIALIESLVERGVRVRILTNSLASNSHVVAHSAYKKWRRSLLNAGAELYEMRADAEILERYRTPPAEPTSLALHTKAAVIDGRLSFIGSPNIDPRSMILNTEIGVIADDPGFAEALASVLVRDMAPENSWRVTLEEGGWLRWWDGDDYVGRQPATGFHQRAVEFFLNLLPIKNQT